MGLWCSWSLRDYYLDVVSRLTGSVCLCMLVAHRYLLFVHLFAYVERWVRFGWIIGRRFKAERDRIINDRWII